jgi:hypothetical protein
MKNHRVEQRLNLTAEQKLRLARLQSVFAKACSSLGPIVRETRCWNRVALHHLAYRRLRSDFPELGSQMACNAIYSVSRAARLIYQSPNSPWCLDKLGDRPLPLLAFADSSPVYFDRHTLSLRDGRLSMFTLDGRIKFDIELAEGDLQHFQGSKLREIVLGRNSTDYFLTFQFGDAEAGAATGEDLPEYILVVESDAAAAA